MGYKIDLQIHTSFSDGSLYPKEIVDLAIKEKIKVFAVTDHDTVEGIEEALNYAQDKPVEVIPGIEFSCEETKKGYPEVHILGLFIDYNNKELVSLTQQIKEKRNEQKKEMIEKLRSFGYDISYEEIIQTVGSSFGRPHIAKLLLKKYPNRFKKVQDVFDQYLGLNKPAYVPRRDKIYVWDAVKIIKGAGGIAVLAHPLAYKEEEVKPLVELFVSAGGQALETSYPYYLNLKDVTKEESDRKNLFAQQLAQEKGLLETGGSDFHGGIRPTQIGDGGINEEMFSKLKEAVNSNP